MFDALRIAPAAAAVLVAASSNTVAADQTAISAALEGRCRSRGGVMLVTFPRQPTAAGSLRVVALSERPIAGATLAGKGPRGRLQLAAVARGGPPHWWFAQIDRPRSGRYRFVLVDGAGKLAGCASERVRPASFKPDVKVADEAWWKSARSWNRRRENLYSVWIEKLFDAPADQRPTWSPLHAVLRDPKRNFLHNHLGANEDGPDPRKAVVVEPDCADLPYFLRAYFAWKLHLPFGYRACSRGRSTRPPRCGELKTNLEAPSGSKSTPADRFSYFVRRRASYVHSGAAGTAADDSETDLYPLALTRAAIRPGTVYVDPAGHLMVIARWFPQQGGRSGQLFVIESQPDLTVGRKRFWRGAMLFEPRPKGPAGGFKAFRPLAVNQGQIAALTNDEIRASRDYGNYSAGQYRISKDAFYERVDRLINPEPLSPTAAYREQLAAFFELIQKRKDSVATGEDYMKRQGFKPIGMPQGPRIFQTSGPWEDYSTPARDFRLLIAIDQVLGFPSRVTRHPDRFALPAGKKPATVARELEALLQRVAREKQFSYIRSDGSSWTLTMADVIARRRGLEVGYNPNDCIEVRWAASGEELSTCSRHAPDEQRQRMKAYRPWFAKRTRPPIR